MKPDFPLSWLAPQTPAYGTFPWPFRSRQQSPAESESAAEIAMAWALNAGYRHFDTAFTYKNQHCLGRAIRRSNISRNDVFVTSKLHPNDNSNEGATTRITEAIETIFGKANEHELQYLDAFLIHYPGTGDPIGAWRALIDAQESGQVRYIGVSNFEVRHLERLAIETRRMPQINQIEFHPWIAAAQMATVEFCRNSSIALEGHSPLAEGIAVHDSDISAIAKRNRTTPARIALQWCMQHGLRPIVGSRSRQHISENVLPYEFSLSSAEMSLLDRKGHSMPVRLSQQWHWSPHICELGESK